MTLIEALVVGVATYIAADRLFTWMRKKRYKK